MCEAIKDDFAVFAAKDADVRLRLIEDDGEFVPFNPRNRETQRVGFREEAGERIPVYWKFGRWNDAPH